MAPLILSIFGSLLALGGLVALLPQVRAQQLDSGSLGAWIFRAGILVLLVGETIALFARPEAIVLKTMLVLSAAVVFVCLAIFLREWQQPGYVLERSFGWLAVALGMATFLTAVMYIEPVVMLVAAMIAFFGVREFRRRAKTTTFEYSAVQNLVIALQATIVVFTLILLVL